MCVDTTMAKLGRNIVKNEGTNRMSANEEKVNKTTSPIIVARIWFLPESSLAESSFDLNSSSIENCAHDSTKRQSIKFIVASLCLIYCLRWHSCEPGKKTNLPQIAIQTITTSNETSTNCESIVLSRGCVNENRIVLCGGNCLREH